jgi:hypothetical protein
MELLRELERSHDRKALLHGAVGTSAAGPPKNLSLTQSHDADRDAGRKRARYEHEVDQRDGERNQRRDQAGPECQAGPFQTLAAGEDVKLNNTESWICPERSQLQVQRSDFHAILQGLQRVLPEIVILIPRRPSPVQLFLIVVRIVDEQME